MEDMTAIKINSVSKNFSLPHQRADSIKSMFVNPFQSRGPKSETQHALKNISFDVKKGEFFGIVGRNGSGKSTLLKLIAGIYQPTEGGITINGRLVPFIELGVGFNPELSGRENVYLNGALMGFSKAEVDEKYNAIVDFSELKRFMDQKLKNYSSGMQVRLAFSVATVLARSDILLIDEVLAVGDSAFQKKCFAYFRKLKKEKKTVVFVSHDMNAIQEYCDRAVLIESSELVLEGTPSDIAAAYTRMFADQELRNENDLKKLKKRWGSGEVSYGSVEVTPKEVEKQTSLTIKVDAKSKVDVDGEVIFGFKIKDSEGKPLVGTNTRIKEKNIHLSKNETVTIEWDLPILFNDGVYRIDVAIEQEDYTGIYDWWEDAATFTIQRNEQSSYSINPIIKTKVVHVKKK
jgi:ABC-2 type transport system ATP-binding protein